MGPAAYNHIIGNESSCQSDAMSLTHSASIFPMDLYEAFPIGNIFVS